MLANQAMNFLASGVSPRAHGQRPSQHRPLPDVPGRRWVHHHRRGQRRAVSRVFARRLGLDALAADARFSTNAARVANREELTRALTAKTRLRARAELLAALEKAVVPAGPINTVADLFADPQFVARGMRIDPEGNPGVRSPIANERQRAVAWPPFAETR